MTDQERITALEAAIVRLDDALNRLTSRLETHEEYMDNRLDSLSSRLEHVDDKQGDDLYRIDTQVSRLESEVHSISGRVDDLRYHSGY